MAAVFCCQVRLGADAAFGFDAFFGAYFPHSFPGISQRLGERPVGSENVTGSFRE